MGCVLSTAAAAADSQKPVRLTDGHGGSARVVRVKDGDTAELVLTMPTLFAAPVVHVCRLTRFDAPESKGPTDLERLHARACTTMLAEHLNTRPSWPVAFAKRPLDTYGRFLVDLDGGSVAAWMQAHTPARAYTGRQKRAPWNAFQLKVRNDDPLYAKHLLRAAEALVPPP